jgi:hypothetical protein
MSKVVAIMSMSLDGYIADLNDGVAEVFDWYFASGEVEFHTGGSDPMTFKVSAPSAEHLRGLWSELGAEGRRLLRGQPLEHYVHELSEVRRLTLESLAARDDGWLERTLSAAPAMNAHWAWFHVAEDEINHRGQMRWLRARLGSTGTGRTRA